MRIGAPVEQKIEEVESPVAERLIKRTIAFLVGVVSVAQEQENESVVALIESDLEGGLKTSPRIHRLFRELKRPAYLDPTFYVVESTVAAEILEFRNFVRVIGDSRGEKNIWWRRINSWIGEGSRTSIHLGGLFFRVPDIDNYRASSKSLDPNLLAQDTTCHRQ